jgi:hypothetical protein
MFSAVHLDVCVAGCSCRTPLLDRSFHFTSSEAAAEALTTFMLFEPHKDRLTALENGVYLHGFNLSPGYSS